MHKDYILYRIISGRTKLDLGGFFVFVYEPKHRLVTQSYEIYQEAYDSAYASGSYIDSELKMLLIEQDIWTPLNDRDLEEIKNNIDDRKVEAFENYQNPKNLRGIKQQIALLNKKYNDLSAKKMSLDHLLCHSVAEIARQNWILSRCYRPKNLSIDIARLSNLYNKNAIPYPMIRQCARLDIWRTMWMLSKTGKGPLFDRNPTDYSKDQLALSSFSTMYDNVFEHPESPDSKVIEDDDCLDGWFIHQRRKADSAKKQKNAEDLIKNPKIKAAKEVFVVASDQDHANNIYDANSQAAKSIITQRSQVINEKGKVSDLDFDDVKLEQGLLKNNITRDAMRRR